MIMPVTLLALYEELAGIGVHPLSYEIFKNRSEIKPLKLFAVRTPAANIIKQELLSSGADCAVNENCITGKVEYSDVLILATVKQYREFLRKLAPMRFFGIPEIIREISDWLDMTPAATLLADGREIDYSMMCVMGIINMTEDSFYSASRQGSTDKALAVAESMLADGAGVLDIGSESTRPGSLPLSADEESERLVPVIEGIKKRFPKSIISVDTYRADTARRALEAGADIINDITGVSSPEMAELLVRSKAPVVIMHMQGTPQNMQDAPFYNDVVKEVYNHLSERSSALMEKGLAADKIIVDPGIGFGKSKEHNLALIKRLGEFTALGHPVLLAASRKTVISDVFGGLLPEDRLEGTVALSCQAVVAGAHMVRVHDVKENVRVVRMLEAVRR